MPRELRFDGRVALVTGAGGGLGREYALLLAARGAHVVVNDIGGQLDGTGADAGAAERVVGEIRSGGGSAVANRSSVTSVDGADEMVATAIDAFGSIDIVVNNAGIIRDRAFQNMSFEDQEAVLDVHLRGTFAVTRAAWPHMRERRYGRVLNTSSVSGLVGQFGQANYGAAKMGIAGLTRVLAIEGAARGIQVNAIAPSAATRMTIDVISEGAAQALHPAKVAPAVAWLLHEDCTVTGEIIAAGGGRVARYYIGQTRGAFRDSPTPESVRDDWERVVDLEEAIIPKTSSDELVILQEMLVASGAGSETVRRRDS